jgi:sulfide:quinone oxidoreductase
MTGESSSGRFRVVIAGGGVAGVEAALALAELAGQLTEVTVIAPNAELVNRPMTVREPFAYPRAERHALEAIVRDAGAELVVDELSSVDPANRTVRTAGGGELGYDALLLALGARVQAHYEHAITIDDRHLDETLAGLIQDVEGGYVKQIAYLVPARMPWPLPLYEIALMTAGRAYDMNVELAATVVTPEDSPLAIFGSAASEAVAERLAAARIQTLCSSYAEVPRAGEVHINPGERELRVDRIVALPELHGVEVPGIPVGDHGFMRTSQHSEVLELERVYAAGDCVDFPVKHGGLSSQMADAAAESIAALAGAAIEPQPFEPEIRGMLLTDGKPIYLRAYITGGHGFSSQVSDTPTWSPPSKISTKYLSAYLEARRGAGAASS